MSNNIMRTAIMSNTTLAAVIRRAEERKALAAKQREIRRVKHERDVAIVALIKARRNKKRSRDILTDVLDRVAAVRAVVE